MVNLYTDLLNDKNLLNHLKLKKFQLNQFHQYHFHQYSILLFFNYFQEIFKLLIFIIHIIFFHN